MFRKLLIANRGEIACRVAATARRMGIATVAVYSDADRGAVHVEVADEAVRIGPAPAAKSYLDIAAVIAAARATGAEAVHPGYGFLAENADFAEAVAAAGLVFVGPPAAAIRAMASKSAAKEIMAKAGVPLVPGYHGRRQDLGTLGRAAEKIGYPVLLKAALGGGGRGMRVVAAAADLADAVAAARREAKAAFGDDTLLIEKYLQRPRHVEVQVFADTHGNRVHLAERDCSIQRRHQKVVEEAPAPGLDPDTRAAMAEAALDAAAAIGYVGAGTVEFLLDPEDGAFYFMEMNTRLQVEHPVTEMVFGLDLVEWQLRVAAGEPLVPGSSPGMGQADLVPSGHAVEARLYAEDPAKGFLPAGGRLVRFRVPDPGAIEGTRIDAGVREGDTVPVFYDPMIAKLIAWGETREAALLRLKALLDGTEVAGVASNLDFLGALVAHPAFAAGAVDTGFIERHLADLVPPPGPADDLTLAAASLYLLLERNREARTEALASGDPHSPWHQVDGWRLNGDSHHVLRFLDGEAEVAVTVRFRGGAYGLDLPGGTRAASAAVDDDGALLVEVGGRRVRAAAVRDGDTLTVRIGGRARRLAVIDAARRAEAADVPAGSLTAPMPGKVVAVTARAGAHVARGEALMVIEAMKMEHTITAPAEGRISAVHFAPGAQVEEGAVLVSFAEPDPDAAAGGT